MLIQPTIQKLKTLKLYGMAEATQSFMDNPQTSALSFDEKLGVIVDHELTQRKINDKRVCSKALSLEPLKLVLKILIINIPEDWIKAL